jgi:hypothetical protein
VFAIDARRDDLDAGVRGDGFERRRLPIVNRERRKRGLRRARLEPGESPRLPTVHPGQGHSRRLCQRLPFQRVNVNQIENEWQSGQRGLEREARHAGAVREHDIGTTGSNQPIEDGSNCRGIQ